MAGHPQHLQNGRGRGGVARGSGGGLLHRRNKLSRSSTTTTEFPGLSQLESGGRSFVRMMSGGGTGGGSGRKVAQVS